MNENATEERTARVRYRPDIDGLRAVAVLLVLADHLHTRFTGGYIGVDVFFVISGYLISANILSEMGRGEFTIAGFYERRIRRIFPAMLVMMAVVSAAVVTAFIPHEIEDYARSLLAAILSVSNFEFWHESGYFDAGNLFKPLLHTWSLGVEEQFYILFPLFLMVVRRWFPARLKPAIFAVAGLSFVAAVATVPGHPVAAFFFTPLRAWELLIGTMVSQHYVPSIRNAVSRNVASAAGLLLIVVPALLYTDHTQFPGLTALLPCGGAALIIAAGEHGWSAVARFLSWRPVVFVGLISYSLYLWHWPLIVLQNSNSILFPGGALDSAAHKALLALVSLLLATLSWAFVERPFRKGRFRPARRTLFAMSGLAVGGLTAAAVALLALRGLNNRLSPEAKSIAAYMDVDLYGQMRGNTCFIGEDAALTDFQPATCLAQHPGKPSILLAGDSHAAQLWQGFSTAYPDHDVLQATIVGCRPAMEMPDSARKECGPFYHSLFDDFLAHHHVDTLLLAGRWHPEELSGLGNTVRQLQERGIHVVVIGPAIEFDRPLPRLLVTNLRAGHPERTAEHRLIGPQDLDRTMASLAASTWHVQYISVYGALCKPVCPLYVSPGVPLLNDTDHFTLEGATLFAQTLRATHQVE